MIMGNMTWTNDQLKAINYPADSSACVSAAAGSGKTALLIERVVSLIRGKDDENIPPVPADSFAILTFTRNAAEEFRTRMTQAIEKASRTAGNERIPREQLIKFRSSYVGTINSFCLSVLRDNPQLFDLPVNFSIVEEGRAAIMMNRALDNTMEYFYTADFLADFDRKYAEFGGVPSGEGNAAREQLIKTYSYTDDESLRKDIKNVYYKSTSLADRTDWLEHSAKVFSSIDKAESFFLPYVAESIPPILADIRKNADKARSCCNNIDEVKNKDLKNELKPMVDRVGNYADLVIELCNKYICSKEKLTFADLNEFHDQLKGHNIPVVGKVATRAKAPDTANKSGAVSAMTNAVSCFTSLQESLGYDSASFEEERKNQFRALTALVVLIERLESEFRAIKRKSAVVDFADCEQLLLAELRKPDSELRKSLSERYRCIIIDEFQDTNDLQYTIFSTISRDKKNLFFVGDIKQSIYAFRGGNPEIMAACCENGSGFEKLPLNKNFRSRNSVITTVNAMFDGIMTRTYGDVEYSDNNQLVPGARFPDSGSDYSSELHLLQYTKKQKKDDSKNKKSADGAADTKADSALPGDSTTLPDDIKPSAAVSEARYAGNLIRKMIREKFQVKAPDDKTRPCTWRDFAVLLRNKTNISEYKKEFEEQGIPVVSDAGDYLEADEINLILSYLKVIDNPQLDEHLLPVLMSPLYGFTANELSLARLGLLPFEREQENKCGEDMTRMYNYYAKQSLFNCIMDAAGGDNSTLYVSDEIDEIRSKLKKLETPDAGVLKCQKFASQFMEFRRFAASNSVERLIRHIYDNTDLFSVISTYERGDRKLANIRYLLTYTKDFEKYGGGTLNDFLRYTDSMKKNIDNIKEAAVPQQAADSVKLMTFHASKGLQWPIVILGQLGADFHKTESYKIKMIIDRKAGIGLKNAFIEQRRLAYSLGFNAAKLSTERQQKGEELRVLYVAMTRAEEKLIMIGCCSEKRCGDLRTGSYTTESVLSGNSFLDWILPSMYRYGDNASDDFPKYLEKASLKLFPIADRPDDEPYTNPTGVTTQETDPDDKTAENISREIGKQYAYIYDTTLQSRFSVTELAHRNDEDRARKAEEKRISREGNTSGSAEKSEKLRDANQNRGLRKLTRPSFMSDNPDGIKVNGFLVGNTYHHIMELFPLETLRADYSPDDMEAAVENGITELIENSLLTPEECYVAETRKQNFITKVTDFFLSRLGQEMLSAQRVEREYSIFAELPAAELLPDSGADKDSRTILQGRIDMLYILDDKLVVVDYKSDTSSNLEEEMESYCQQVMLYRKILPMLMKECSSRSIELYLYSFEQEREINVEEASSETEKNNNKI